MRGFASSDSIGRKSVIFQIFSQLIVFALLTVALIADLRLFIGVATGLILVPLVICVNAITEKIGVTHNCWGEKEEAVDWKK